MRRILGLLAVSSTLALSACVVDAGPGAGEEGENEELEQADVAPMIEKAIVPTIQQHVQNQAGKPGGSNGISNHGGPVMHGTVNLYYIWYGTWSGNSATTILTDFANSISGSGYWN